MLVWQWAQIYFLQFTYQSGEAMQTTTTTTTRIDHEEHSAKSSSPAVGGTGTTVFYSPSSFAPAPSPLTVQQNRNLRMPNQVNEAVRTRATSRYRRTTSIQSPAPTEEERVRYRTPPNAPFQPAFYRTPAERPGGALNPDYRLPGRRRVKTSTERWMTGEKEQQQQYEQVRMLQDQEDYDGDTEF